MKENSSQNIDYFNSIHPSSGIKLLTLVNVLSLSSFKDAPFVDTFKSEKVENTVDKKSEETEHKDKSNAIIKQEEEVDKKDEKMDV